MWSPGHRQYQVWRQRRRPCQRQPAGSRCWGAPGRAGYPAASQTATPAHEVNRLRFTLRSKFLKNGEPLTLCVGVDQVNGHKEQKKEAHKKKERMGTKDRAKIES